MKTPGIIRSGRRSTLRVVAAAVLGIVAAAGIGTAVASWVTNDSSNNAVAVADTLPQGATPTASVTGNSNTASVSFLGVSSTGGLDVTDYVITRHPAGGGSGTVVSASCTGTTTITCTVAGEPDGEWKYTDTPSIAGTGWVGDESDLSNAVTVDTTAPSVVDVSSTKADGAYKAGVVIPITVEFSEPVTVTGTPQLTLATGTPATTAVSYTGGSATDTLTFTYTVAAGNTSPDLSYASTSALSLNGGSIADAVLNPADLTLPGVSAAHALATNKDLEIDTTAPVAPSTPDLTAASDSGSSSIDDLTNDTTPDLTGTAETNAVVTLLEGATTRGTTSATGGTWTITSATLGTGPHTLTATATDAAGNTSVASTSLVVTIDTTAPSAPGTPDMTSATDTGTSSGDNRTKDDTPDLTVGSVVSGDTVTLFDGASNVGSVVASSTSVTITSASLTDGSHTMTAKSTDPAGNTSNASGGLTITIDTVAPSTPSSVILTNGGGQSNQYINRANRNGVDFDVAWSAGATSLSTDTIQVTITSSGGGSPASDSSNRGGSSPTSFTIDASANPNDGTITASAQATDIAGNVSGTTTNSSTILKDTVNPSNPSTPDMTAATDSGSSSSDNITNDTTPDFTGTAEAGSTVTLLEGATTRGTGVATGGTWTITSATLGENGHSITARSTDLAGNTSGTPTALSVMIDTNAPSAPGTPNMTDATDSGSSSSDNTTNDATPDFTGSAEAGSTVTLLEGASTRGSGTATGGTWTITSSSLGDGGHSMTARATDAAGNTSGSSGALAITIDTVAPSTPTSVAMTNGGGQGSQYINRTNRGSVSFSVAWSAGATSVSSDTIQVTLTSSGGGSSVSGTASRGATSPTSVSVNATSNPNDGTITATAQATDLAGNTSGTVTNATTILKDTVGPSFSSATSSDGDGKFEGGDTLDLTWSEALLTPWTSPATITVTLNGASPRDTVDIPSLISGSGDTGDNGYMGSGSASWANSTLSLINSGTTIRVTLGPTCSGSCANVSTGASSGDPAFTILSTITDVAGNSAANVSLTNFRVF